MICEKLCVSALLDDATEAELIGLQRAIGRREYAAHITLGVYETVDTGALLEWAEEIAAESRAFEVMYTGIGVMLPPFLYAMPRQSDELTRLYRRLHLRFDGFCTRFTSLSGGSWTPHTTLGSYSPEKVDIAVRRFRELRGRIVGLKTVDCSNGGFKETLI